MMVAHCKAAGPDDDAGQALRAVEAAIDNIMGIPVVRFYGDVNRILDCVSRLNGYLMDIPEVKEYRSAAE